MTLAEAKAAASDGKAIGFTWKGERNPKGKVRVFVKKASCSKAVSKGAGWHTMLKAGGKPPCQEPPAKRTRLSFDPKYDFTMTFLDGTKRKLSDVFDGKPVVLYQYNAF